MINTVRIHDKIMVTDGVNPIRFYYANDPQQLLYTYDEDGNALYTGHSFPELEENKS